MSQILSIYVPEGIVMASDSRITRTITNQSNDGKKTERSYILTDSAYKTFSCPNHCGLSFCGNSDIEGKPMSYWIEKFISEKIAEETKVSEVPQKLLDYILSMDNINNFIFHVCGYEIIDGKPVQKVYRVFTKADTPIVRQNNELDCGAMWNGVNETINRLIKNQINSPTLYKAQNVVCKDGEKDKTLQDALVVESEATIYDNAPISWECLYLQDAIDLAKFLIETTIDMMRFEMVDQTVGGPIDILVIKPDENNWIQHKEIHG